MMEEHNIIQSIISKCTHEIASEVEYEYLKEHIASIFSRITLQRAEGGKNSKSSHEIMINICEAARYLDMKNFIKFAFTLKHDYNHVFEKINEDFKKRTGRDMVLEEENIHTTIVSQATECSSAPVFSVSSLSSEATSSKTSSSGQSFQSVENGDPELALNCKYISIGQGVGCSSDQQPQHNNSTVSSVSTPVSTQTFSSDQVSHASSSSENTSASQNSFRPSDLSAPPGASQISSQSSKYEIKKRANPNDVYEMNTNPRGNCIIISNEVFDILKERKGSSNDCSTLTNMFRFLGFFVESYKNKTANEMRTLLKEFATSQCQRQVSALAVVILSHGGENECIYGSDGACVNKVPMAGTFITTLELRKIFNGKACPAMNGKPKLFIIQACRGETEDQVHPGLGSIERDSPNESFTVPDNAELENSKRSETADMFFLHSSTLGYKSYRSTKIGSPFVNTLNEKMLKFALEKSLISIVKEVQTEMSTQKIGEYWMTMPEFSATLTKLYYFNPPI